MWKCALYAVVMFIVSSCGSSGATQQTLEAYGGTSQARLNSLYLTGTVQAERLRVTLEFVETRAAQATIQQGQIISTLQERGIDVSILPQAATPLPTQAQSSNGVAAPIVTPGGPAPQVTRAAPTSSNEFVSELVTSTSVGDDDCATGITNQFSSSAESIYVVGVARGIAEGTVMNTQWLNANGEELANYSHTFDAIPEEACVWFFVDQTDFTFEPGSYSVVFSVSDTIAATLPFTIAE